LTHGLGDLSLKLAEDRLDGLTDLLLQRLTQILVGLGRCSPLAVFLRPTVTARCPLALPRSSVLSSRVGLLVAPVSLGTALTVVGSRMTLSRLASRLIVILRLPRPSCLLDSHHASLIDGDFESTSCAASVVRLRFPLMLSSVSRTRRP